MNDVPQKELEKSIWYTNIFEPKILDKLKQSIQNREKTIKGKEHIIHRHE